MTVLSSCTSDNNNIENGGGDNEELAKLKSENRALQDQLLEKDSILNESIALFNEIEENLAMINLKENEIRLKSKNVEMEEDGKQWILQEIQNINYLREANQKKVNQLSKQIKENNATIESLEKMINTLVEKIANQDMEIELLRAELQDLDREYVELLEAYQEQTALTVETMKELNKVYYAYGTSVELEKNGVIVKEGGFIGIGKKTELKNDFNDDYFTELDLNKAKTITVEGGKKFRFITDHPSSAYRVDSNGNSHKITITDPKSFWKVSKYLVVIVE